MSETHFPWKPASEIEPKRGDQFLVAYNDALPGQPPDWRYLAGTVEIMTWKDNRLTVFGPNYVRWEYESCVAWESVEWVIPLGQVAPPSREVAK